MAEAETRQGKLKALLESLVAHRRELRKANVRAFMNKRGALILDRGGWLMFPGRTNAIEWTPVGGYEALGGYVYPELRSERYTAKLGHAVGDAVTKVAERLVVKDLPASGSYD